MFTNVEYMIEFFDERKTLLLHSIRTKKGILSSVLFFLSTTFLMTNWRMFGRNANNGDGFWRIAFFVLLFFELLTYIRILCFEQKRHEKKGIGFFRLILCSTIAGTIWHYTLEMIFNDKIWEMDTKYIYMSICVSAIIFLSLLLLLHSIKAAVFIGSFVYFVWGVAEYYTQLFRGLPMQINDILDAGTALDVMGNFEFELTGKILFVGIMLVCICVNVSVGSDYCIGNSLRLNIISRISGILLICSGVWFLGWSNAYAKYSVHVDGNVPGASFKVYGVQLSFISGARNAIVKPPEKYSLNKILSVSEQYTSDSDDKIGKTPNIIVIMNETFANVDITGTKGMMEKIMPNYSSLKENTVKGKVMVSTLGGGTGKTEYEFLTGNSMRLYGSNMSPYVMLGSRLENSMASLLAAQGYETYAIHPYTATNYNRKNTYMTMGFDTFFSIEDFEDATKVRNYVSDESCYKKITEIIETEQNPVFSFCVTMQNHSPYTTPGYDSQIKLDEISCPEAEQYLSLVHESDRALDEFINYFLNEVEEETLIVFFGDHFPSLSDSFWEYITGIPKEQQDFQMKQQYYETPFFIWANYDIAEEENVNISMNYLSSYALNIAEVKLTGYNKYLLDLREQVPAFSAFAYYGTDGRYHSFGDEDCVEELLTIYDMLQYNELFDKGNTLSGFFSLEE